MKRPVTLMPGDGIGPEITEAFRRVFAALPHPFTWDIQPLGKAAFAATGNALPAATLASVQENGLALKGPVETPAVAGFRSPLVQLRTTLDLYANLRPAHTLIPDPRFPALDLLVVRENTEGLYGGTEWREAVGDDPDGRALLTCWNTRAGCARILRFAFELARTRGRHKVTVVHKASVLKHLSGLFLETARRIYPEYARAFVLEEMNVDASALKLVMTPERFDVIVTTNLFGDILSDLVAGLTGGLGLAPGANLGHRHALFEAVHGSAPDIAGRGIANPIALLLAGALLLDHVGESATANRLRRAIAATVNDDAVRTPDLGGHATTDQLTDAILARLADDSPTP